MLEKVTQNVPEYPTVIIGFQNFQGYTRSGPFTYWEGNDQLN